MNSFELMCKAAKVVSEFQKTHDATCILLIRDGLPKTCSVKDVPPNHPSCLTITKYQQQHGYSNSDIRSIRTALFNLYNLEKACQARQKP